MTQSNTTLLTYQAGWEVRLFDLMTSSQQVGDYVMACTYGLALLEILGLKDNLPQKKMPTKSGGGPELATWQEYYTEILMVGIGKIKQTIDSVRQHYKSEPIIPRYTRPKEPQN